MRWFNLEMFHFCRGQPILFEFFPHRKCNNISLRNHPRMAWKIRPLEVVEKG
eukprot:gene12997-8843_t